MATIHELIPRIIGEMEAVGKDRWNEQQRFKFRGVDDILGALKPLLGTHGVYFVPAVEERIYEQRTTSGNKVMHAVHLRVRFRFYGPQGDHVDAVGWGEGTDMGDKATNKAMTGAMKYVIGQVFAVADAGADADHQSPPDTASAPAVPEGFDSAEDAAAEHQIVSQAIKSLPDDIDRSPFQEFTKAHGWPMSAEHLAELARMQGIALANFQERQGAEAADGATAPLGGHEDIAESDGAGAPAEPPAAPKRASRAKAER